MDASSAPGKVVEILGYSPWAWKLDNKDMFKALYSFFNLIFLLILFKMFAPGLFQLSVELVTNILVLLNNVVLAVSQQGATNLFPPQGM